MTKPAFTADSTIDDVLVALGRQRAPRAAGEPRARVETPLLAALRRAGTRHIYADTADVQELQGVILAGGTQRAEIDGNTANQPLVRRVVGRYLDEDPPAGWASELRAHGTVPLRERLLPLLYAVLCGRIGNDMAAAFGPPWEGSLQIHMSLPSDPPQARRVGALLQRMVPGALVKVPFSPDAPDCFLIARDLELQGIPVNFTSTFSARQAVAAALLADVTRTNIFMGRLNQGLRAERLGEHVVLEAQRGLLRLRREDGLKTQLIAASLRDWQSLVLLAGCDVFTAPCKTLEDFLAQTEVSPGQIRSQLDTSYEDRPGIAPEILQRVGLERVARLYRVEPELVQFLRELREHPEERAFRDGDALYKRFDESGFRDLFHSPTAQERAELREGKLPKLDGGLIAHLPLDTHFTLLANEDFARFQQEIDAEIERRLAD